MRKIMIDIFKVYILSYYVIIQNYYLRELETFTNHV